MYDVTAFIGKEECLRRIDRILEVLPPGRIAPRKHERI